MKMNERIVQLLSNVQMNQKELAEKSGVTESAISHYIKGDRVPRGVNLKKIAVALNTTVDDILGSCGAEDKDVDIFQAKILIARNANNLTNEERMEIIKILMDGKEN